MIFRCEDCLDSHTQRIRIPLARGHAGGPEASPVLCWLSSHLILGYTSPPGPLRSPVRVAPPCAPREASQFGSLAPPKRRLFSHGPVPRWGFQHFAFHHSDLWREGDSPIIVPILETRKLRCRQQSPPAQSTIHAKSATQIWALCLAHGLPFSVIVSLYFASEPSAKD